MRKKKCPYCGRRVPYSVCFGRRRKAEFVCPRCGRESRVYISRSVIFAFLICAILSIALFVLWVYLKLTYNPLGIAAVALPLIIFGLISPRFVNFEPLKKYKKTMEAKRAGIAYSDNLAVSELDNEFSGLDSGSGFRINSDVFNQIKADRSASREQISENELSSTSDKVERPIVHVIDDVSEDHAVDNAPLKKLRSDGSRTRNRHYISSEPVNPAPVTDASRNTSPRAAAIPRTGDFKHVPVTCMPPLPRRLSLRRGQQDDIFSSDKGAHLLSLQKEHEAPAQGTVPARGNLSRCLLRQHDRDCQHLSERDGTDGVYRQHMLDCALICAQTIFCHIQS